MNTIILEKMTSFEEMKVDIFSRLLQNRIIFIDDLINDRAAADVIATLLVLDKDNQNKITIFINADGGDIRNVFAIFDAMQITTSVIETFCVGAGMHEAVLLLAAGTKGHRLISKNADICLSQITSNSMSYSDLTNTKISFDKSIKDNDTFLKELSKLIGKPIKTLKKDTERQKYLTAQQAIKYGIADKMV